MALVKMYHILTTTGMNLAAICIQLSHNEGLFLNVHMDNNYKSAAGYPYVLHEIFFTSAVNKRRNKRKAVH